MSTFDVTLRKTEIDFKILMHIAMAIVDGVWAVSRTCRSTLTEITASFTSSSRGLSRRGYCIPLGAYRWIIAAIRWAIATVWRATAEIWRATSRAILLTFAALITMAIVSTRIMRLLLLIASCWTTRHNGRCCLGCLYGWRRRSCGRWCETKKRHYLYALLRSKLTLSHHLQQLHHDFIVE